MVTMVTMVTISGDYGHEHIAQTYSVHVLTFGTHIFIYMLRLNPGEDFNERGGPQLHVHACTWLQVTLGLAHHCNH